MRLTHRGTRGQHCSVLRPIGTALCGPPARGSALLTVTPENSRNSGPATLRRRSFRGLVIARVYVVLSLPCVAAGKPTRLRNAHLRDESAMSSREVFHIRCRVTCATRLRITARPQNCSKRRIACRSFVCTLARAGRVDRAAREHWGAWAGERWRGRAPSGADVSRHDAHVARTAACVSNLAPAIVRPPSSSLDHERAQRGGDASLSICAPRRCHRERTAPVTTRITLARPWTRRSEPAEPRTTARWRPTGCIPC